MNDNIQIELRSEENGNRIVLTLNGSEPITVDELEDVLIQFLANLPEDDA